MSTRAVEQVDDWESRPFSGGYRGLHDLADDGFSGIVTAGPARLCMTKGTVVGILDGSIESFEDASGTAHEAPSPALPLLAVMQEGDREVRGEYYTEETPIREVDGTLSDGNFTGYVELSENVLSGDYYVVYHQGRSMSVAYVGNAKQLLTEDEAFQRADGEVGIYEVIDASVEVVEIPAADSGAGAAGTAGAAATTETADTEPVDTEPADTEPADAKPADTTDSETAVTPDSQATDAADTAASGSSAEATADSAGASTDEAASTDRTDRAKSPEATPDRASEPESSSRSSQTGRPDDPAPDESRTENTGRESSRGQASTRPDEGARGESRRDDRRGASESADRGGHDRGDAGAPSRGRERGGGESARRDQSPGRTGGGANTAQSGGTRQQETGPSNNAVGTGTVSDLETRTIPSLDPARTSEPEPDPATGGAAGGGGPAPAEPEPRGGSQQRAPEPQQGANRDTQRSPNAGSGVRGARDEPRRDEPAREQGVAADPNELERLEAELDDREAEIDRLEDELADREDRIDELETTLDDMRAERDDLQTRLERMEARIDDLRTGEGGESVADRKRMSPGEAIDGTNLFIRYGSKGEATLENAHAGRASPEDVNANLDIQYHTQFDADDVAVDGEPFDDYLESTIQYRFVEWVVRVLPYEIRDTGHEGALKDLYDAMPRLDRAELNGVVSVVYEEDGEEQRSQESFDVVLRDRMGNPLAVANMNESRDPASQRMMEGLITAARRVSESKESLAGAFLVTSSFFEPEAMEAASQATGGGLLSRDKRQSFVKLSRKEGFHLCLVEARESQFNLSVPEI